MALLEEMHAQLDLWLILSAYRGQVILTAPTAIPSLRKQLCKLLKTVAYLPTDQSGIARLSTKPTDTSEVKLAEEPTTKASEPLLGLHHYWFWITAVCASGVSTGAILLAQQNVCKNLVLVAVVRDGVNDAVLAINGLDARSTGSKASHPGVSVFQTDLLVGNSRHVLQKVQSQCQCGQGRAAAGRHMRAVHIQQAARSQGGAAASVGHSHQARYPKHTTASHRHPLLRMRQPGTPPGPHPHPQSLHLYRMVLSSRHPLGFQHHRMERISRALDTVRS